MVITLASSGFTEFIKYANKVAFNAAAQTFAANTLTTVTLSTQIYDYLTASGSAGSSGGAVAANQFTLTAGAYYGEAISNVCNDRVGDNFGYTLGVYSVTDSDWLFSGYDQNYIVGKIAQASGDFYISATKTCELRVISNLAGSINSGTGATGAGQAAITLATAGLDQRSQIKLWKR